MGDPLATRRGRLATFFLLYVTEGIPVGFAAVAVAAQMRRRGVSPAAVGTFVATLYLPWAWKWAIGPVVDLVYVDRLGRRRGWILAAQLMMVGTLLAAMPVDFASRLTLFTWVIVIHNVFAATQDVAIDALAVGTLPAGERGTANGLMFAGAYLGNAVGGSGALFLAPYVGFNNTFLFVAGAILLVTLAVTLRIREPRRVVPVAEPGAPDVRAPGAAAALVEYVRTAVAAMFGSRAAVAGLAFAILPAGAYALSLALQSNLAVELGMSDASIAWLGLWSTILAAGGCVAGGVLSDRFGRRRMLGLFILTTAVPTLALAWLLHRYGWVMPVDPKAVNRPVPAAGLLGAFWVATLAYGFLQGLMYGARTALYMDLSEPKVAATQFTAYMAVLNLTIAYSAYWQGRASEVFGYPVTLGLDAALGCVGVVLLPWCRREKSVEPSRFEVAAATGVGVGD